MKKYIYYILLSLGILLIYNIGFADIIHIPSAPDIEKVSVEHKGSFGGSVVDSVNSLGFSILNSLKVILGGVLLIYVVYIGVQMVISMGSDEEELSAAKRQLSYILVALVFINIPGTLFEAFSNSGNGSIGGLSGTWTNSGESGNIFINSGAFNNAVGAIVGFLEVLIFIAAIMMLVIAGIRLITARENEEERSNASRRVLWSIVALIFVGIIESWKKVAFSGSVAEFGGIFGNIINIMLFWAAPIALLFMTLAGYYYITSNGDEERVKKAKNIVLYTVIGTVLLLSIYTFLIDLSNLF